MEAKPEASQVRHRHVRGYSEVKRVTKAGQAEGENWLEAKVRGEDSKLAAARESSRAPGRPLMGVGSPTEAAANACLTSRSNSCTHVKLSVMWG